MKDINPVGFEHAIPASKQLRIKGTARFFAATGKKKLWPSISEITNYKGIKIAY
jgi:hypothetical protein